MGRLLVWDGAKARPWAMGVDTIEVVMVVEVTTMDHHQANMVAHHLLDHRGMVADTEGRLGVEETGVEIAAVAVETAVVVVTVEIVAVATVVEVVMMVDENAAVVRIDGMSNDRVIKNQKIM